MTTSPSPRPLSIKVITVLLCCFGLKRVLDVVFSGPLVFFGGLVIQGAPAQYIAGALAAVNFVCARGIWRLTTWAWGVVIGLTAFFLVDSLLMGFSLTNLENLTTTAAATGRSPSDVQAFLSRFVIFQIVLQSAILWFLIRRKSAFVKPGSPGTRP